MELRWLQDFLSLVEAGNFTSAASERHSSQPAFSRRIKSLEAWLGVELIDRTRYPTVLTPAGERFQAHAATLVRKIVDSRAELRGEPISGGELITFALPHALATSRFPAWWQDWRGSAGNPSCRLIANHVHDTVTAFVAGLADVLICFHHAHQPINLDLEQYRCIALGPENLTPYAASRLGLPAYALPGTSKSVVPLLNYSSGAFLGRMVDLLLQSVTERLHGENIFESGLADVLLEMAVAGHGVAWLPESTAAPALTADRLRIAGDQRWTLPLKIYAYCDRERATSAVNKLMNHLEICAAQYGSAEQIES